MTEIPFSSAYWTNPYLYWRTWSKTQMLASVLNPHSFHSFIHFSFTTSPHPIATVLAPNHSQNRPKDPPIYIQGHPQPWTWTPFFKLKTHLFNSPTSSIHPSTIPFFFVESSFIFCTIYMLNCNLLPRKVSLRVRKALINVILLLLVLMTIMMLMRNRVSVCCSYCHSSKKSKQGFRGASFLLALKQKWRTGNASLPNENHLMQA